ncbi:hypothetical protein [Embleya scabrispora]|uniref:hypothetical protein n=1 Tax=Embleya scabrispora TaxID=159449 RepID=UPI0003740397|nr:hypothetical protein [Embleya scabrispora]MYS80245.1 hypothetical protein [Streptomyces sp. SID5474]
MTSYGITGHINISAGTVPLVDRAIRDLLAGAAPEELVGYSCLAAGADAIFARAVLDLGGRLVALLPSADYGDAKVGPHYRASFDQLVAAAAEVRVMPFRRASADAYAAANEALLAAVDVVFAVWDGQPGRARGGTAEVVGKARSAGKRVHVVWPTGAARG